MEDEETEYHKYHNALVDEFINKNNYIAFKKLFNMRTTKKPKRNIFLSEVSNSTKKNRNEQRTITHTNNEMDTQYKIDRLSLLTIESSNVLKGNNKWALQRFKLLKMNRAKRYGIPYNEFHLPKYNVNDYSLNQSVFKENKLSKSMKGLKLPLI